MFLPLFLNNFVNVPLCLKGRKYSSTSGRRDTGSEVCVDVQRVWAVVYVDNRVQERVLFPGHLQYNNPTVREALHMQHRSLSHTQLMYNIIVVVGCSHGGSKQNSLRTLSPKHVFLNLIVFRFQLKHWTNLHFNVMQVIF